MDRTMWIPTVPAADVSNSPDPHSFPELCSNLFNVKPACSSLQTRTDHANGKRNESMLLGLFPLCKYFSVMTKQQLEVEDIELKVLKSTGEKCVYKNSRSWKFCGRPSL
jgi:hypothetical protein